MTTTRAWSEVHKEWQAMESEIVRLRVEVARLRRALEQETKILDDVEAENEWRDCLYVRIKEAHEQHLRTGDYAALGMATQDALALALLAERSNKQDTNPEGGC